MKRFFLCQSIVETSKLVAISNNVAYACASAEALYIANVYISIIAQFAEC